MTGTSFLLFTNLAQTAKVVNLLSKRHRIGEILKEADYVLRDVHSDEEKEIVKRSVTFCSYSCKWCHGECRLRRSWRCPLEDQVFDQYFHLLY